MNLTADDMAKGWSHQNPILEHTLLLRVFGCIEYSDREGEQPPHRTPFDYLVLTQKVYITSDTKYMPAEQLDLEPLGTDSSQTR